MISESLSFSLKTKEMKRIKMLQRSSRVLSRRDLVPNIGYWGADMALNMPPVHLVCWEMRTAESW